MAKANSRVRLAKGSYSAQQVPGAVVLLATGSSRTSGVQVFFERGKTEIFPPTFSLMEIPPAGMALQIITPFIATAGFRAEKKVSSVTVNDSDGKHQVEVVQTPD